MTKTTDGVRTLAAEVKDNPKLDEEQRKLFYKAKHEKVKNVTDLAHIMKAVEEVKEYVSVLSKFVNAEYDMIRLELMPALMEEQGIEGMKIEDLGRLGLAGDMYVSIKAGCKEDFLKWLKKYKLGDLAKPEVNSSTLKAFVKARMAGGKPLPTELLNVTPFTRASITKA